MPATGCCGGNQLALGDMGGLSGVRMRLLGKQGGGRQSYALQQQQLAHWTYRKLPHLMAVRQHTTVCICFQSKRCVMLVLDPCHVACIGYDSVVAELLLPCLMLICPGLQVTPLSWPMHTIRKVLQEALDSPASDAELAATTAAVQAEFQRLGRFSSFSSSQMAPPQLQQQQQQEQGHGTAEGATGEGASSSSSGQQSAVQLEPLPGPVEPHTEASAAALASQRSAEPGQPGASAVDEEQHQHQQQALQAAVQLAVKRSMSLGSLRGSSGSLRRLVQPEGQQENEVEPAESGVLGEMDAALIDMMADMDMDIVMPTLPAVGGGPAGGSNAQ